MSLFIVDKANFNFNNFVKTTMKFIGKSFGGDSPIQTLRYFYSFNINIEENNNYELKEIKRAIPKLNELYKKRKIIKLQLNNRIDRLKKIERLITAHNEESIKKRNIPTKSIPPEKLELKDFKKLVLNDATLFFPYSSGLEEGGMISTACGKRILIGNENEMQIKRKDDDWFAPLDYNRNPGISMTDCFGFLVKAVGDVFIFIPAIAWGDMASSIEPTNHSGIQMRMHKYLKSFMKEEKRIWLT